MPVYNVFEATRRSKRKIPKDSPVSAGVAKVPRVGVNTSDLEAQGELYGWTAKPLTYNEVLEMSSSELRWHEAFNKENVDRAFTLAENQRLNRERMPVWNVRRMWKGKATPEEDEKARIAGDAFAIRTPQFARTVENATLMIEHMQRNDLDATQVSSYVTAFRVLTAEGKIALATPESADDFLHNHPELHDRRTPPIIAARNVKVLATAEHFQRAEAATASAGVTQVTKYPESERIGYGDHTRYSFRKLLDSLPADDYKKRLIEDKSFSAAVDKLNNGKQ
jgi:hypothetical protein